MSKPYLLKHEPELSSRLTTTYYQLSGSVQHLLTTSHDLSDQLESTFIICDSAAIVTCTITRQKIAFDSVKNNWSIQIIIQKVGNILFTGICRIYCDLLRRCYTNHYLEYNMHITNTPRPINSCQWISRTMTIFHFKIQNFYWSTV